MGLFDFLKKKKLTQSSSAKELNAPNSQGIQSKESALPFVKKEVVAKTPLVEISVEQDCPLPLSTLLIGNTKQTRAIPSRDNDAGVCSTF